MSKKEKKQKLQSTPIDVCAFTIDTLDIKHEMNTFNSILAKFIDLGYIQLYINYLVNYNIKKDNKAYVNLITNYIALHQKIVRTYENYPIVLKSRITINVPDNANAKICNLPIMCDFDLVAVSCTIKNKQIVSILESKKFDIFVLNLSIVRNPIFKRNLFSTVCIVFSLKLKESIKYLVLALLYFRYLYKIGITSYILHFNLIDEQYIADDYYSTIIKGFLKGKFVMYFVAINIAGDTVMTVGQSALILVLNGKKNNLTIQNLQRKRVIIMSKSTSLTVDEKDKILKMLYNGISINEIALNLKRDHRTICRYIENPPNKRKRKAKGSFKGVSVKDISHIKLEMVRKRLSTSLDIFKSSGLTDIPKTTRCIILKTIGKVRDAKGKPGLTKRHLELRLS
ncbi:hypothetical protein A3Q56_01682 [Intoshia linei]|uniref:Transposase IS30-like HTH domain-containing protein n=1 Tax=Intoshia linei TaxID=1819745 RepID=A0A177B8J5_9BILA|nr:hypothetical protein A3Q56_01682 [Intoshia linei]